MGDLRKNFDRDEFACPDCGKYIENDKLADTVQAIRDYTNGKPVHIISGTRCQTHNKDVGGVRNSGHTTGEAADIQVPGMSNKDLGILVKQLYGMGRLPHLTYCYLIGGGRSLHVGVDKKPRKSVFGF